MAAEVGREGVVNVRGVELNLYAGQDFVSSTIRSSGDFYEAGVLDEIRHRVTGGVLIDVGAHIGNHTAYLAEFVRHSAIYAFEPYPPSLRLLRLNTARYPTVVVRPEALSDRAGWATIRPEPGNFGHVSIGLRLGPVETRTLDSFGFENVSLIKIDVERHEPQVIAGARKTIERWRPLIVVEDWDRIYAPLLPEYRLAREWQDEHQTYLYEPA